MFLTFSLSYSRFWEQLPEQLKEARPRLQLDCNCCRSHMLCLLQKENHQYASVLLAFVATARNLGVGNCLRELLMSDFELAIIDACQDVFPHTAVSLCFFYLMQSLYQTIQGKGLRRAYNNPDDRKVKEFTQKL